MASPHPFDRLRTSFNHIRLKSKFVYDTDVEKCFDNIDWQALSTKLNAIQPIARLVWLWLEAGIVDKRVTPQEYCYTRLDVVTGVAFGNLISVFIVICTGATLFVYGIQVETAEQAALALAPLAGPWARYLFNVGLLGASLLAASVLPLATTYAVCEAFGWERGMNNRPQEAPIFYSLYTGLVALSAAVVLLPGVSLFPLMWLSQTLNAILLPVLLVLMLRLANDAHLMGAHRNSRMSNVLAWGLTGLIMLITLILFAAPL